MSTAAMGLAEIAGSWRVARQLYPVYSAAIRQFKLSLALSPELESPINRAEPAALENINKWFLQADAVIEVWQLRQILQATDLGSDETLLLLLRRQLAGKSRTASTRDKIDYLLAQYFAHGSPQDAHNTHLTIEHVAEVLYPIFGYVNVSEPPMDEAISGVLKQMDACASLGDLLSSKVLDKARAVKEQAGEAFFAPAAMIAFTRFSFLMRLGFFRLMHADLHAVRQVLHDLEQLHVATVDCSAAGLSAGESLTQLRQICHEWKRPFRAAYTSGNNFRQLVEIRAAVEGALTSAKAQAATAKSPAVAVAAASSPQVSEVEARPSEPAKEPPSESPKTPKIDEPPAKEEKREEPPSHEEKREEPHPEPPAKANTSHETGAHNAEAHAAAAQQLAAIAAELNGSATALAQPRRADLAATLETIAEQLLSAPSKSSSVTNLMIGGTKQLLASWEVAAFTNGGDEVSDALQRAVAARVALSVESQLAKAESAADVAGALEIAVVEMESIQARVTEAKQAKNIDGAVNLAATAKRLLAAMEEAKKTS